MMIFNVIIEANLQNKTIQSKIKNGQKKLIKFKIFLLILQIVWKRKKLGNATAS